MSSALSFRTLLAMVPTLVLVIRILRLLGAFEGRRFVRPLLERVGSAQIVVVQPPE